LKLNKPIDLESGNEFENNKYGILKALNGGDIDCTEILLGLLEE